MSKRIASGPAFLAASIILVFILSGRSAAIQFGAVERQNSARPTFEVASVKPGDATAGISVQGSGRRFEWTNIPVSEAVLAAYRIGEWQISGLPGWARDERFTIHALTPEGSVIKRFPFRDDGLMLMLQCLLEDRFKLQYHWQQKPSNVFALVIAGGRPKLKAAVEKEPEDTTQRTGMSYRRGSIQGMRASMPELSRAISQLIQASVVDKTGLGGDYDFEVNFARSDEDMDVSLSTALQQQLGLRLQKERGEAQMFVVDRVDHPDIH